MDKRKTAKSMRDSLKTINNVAENIRKEHMFAKYQKTMDIKDRYCHYEMCKALEKELIEAVKTFGEGVTAITQELNKAYDHLTILTKKEAKKYQDQMLEAQEEAKTQAEQLKQEDQVRRELLDNHGFRGPTGDRLVEEGKVITYGGKGSVKRRKLILPTDRKFYE
jgi:hypothetical protein